MAYDGDNAGRLVGRSILANDEAALNEVSNRINLGHEVVRKWVEEHGGKVVSGGGDEGTFSIPSDAVDNIEELRRDYKFATNLTMTVGVGKSLSEAGKSLLAGKLRGKDRVVIFDNTVEGEISSAHDRVQSGSGSDEDKKLDEAYISNGDDKPKPGEEAGANQNAEDKNKEGYQEYTEADSNSNERLDGKEGDAAQKNTNESQEEATAPKGSDATEDRGMKDTYQERNPDEDNLKDNDSNEPGDKDMSDSKDKKPNQQPNDKEKPKEKQHEIPKGKDEKGKGPAKEAVGKNPEASEAGEEESADQESGQEEGQEKDVMDNLSDEELASSGESEEGCSRPPHFKDEQAPGDMGVGNEPASEGDADALFAEEGEDGEDPDFGGVLEEGLDNEADNIHREKVVQMVSAALSGFKANKEILERAKEKAPELYSSCIAMLKAMIEMSKMLGLAAPGAEGAIPGNDSDEEELPIDENEEEEVPVGEEGQEGLEENGEEGKPGKEGFEGKDKKEDKEKKPEGKEGKFPPKDKKPAAGQGAAAPFPKKESR